MFIPDAGGDSKFDPIGMTVHMSCSDTFEDGWGSTAGPAEGVDTKWRVFSYYIVKAQGAPYGTPPPPEPGTIIVETQTDPDGATATVDFTRDAAGTIGNDGTVWQDTNKYGVQDSGEAGINGAPRWSSPTPTAR